MTSRAKKNTAPAKRRAAKQTEHPATAVEKAQAIPLTREKDRPLIPGVLNPFVQRHSRDTAYHVAGALQYLSQCVPYDQGLTLTERMMVGNQLILQTLAAALDAAEALEDTEAGAT